MNTQRTIDEKVATVDNLLRRRRERKCAEAAPHLIAAIRSLLTIHSVDGFTCKCLPCMVGRAALEKIK